MKFLGVVLVVLGMLVVASMASNPVPVKNPQPHPQQPEPMPIAELHKPGASKEDQNSGSSFLVDIPFKWIIIRTFTFTIEPVEDHKMMSSHHDESHHKMMSSHHSDHHQQHDQQQKHQDSFCLQFLEPARTECLMAVTRNLEKRVEKQQAELETMAFLLENEVRFFGVQLTHFIFVVCFVFFLISIIRCLKRRRHEEDEEDDCHDEEDEETPEIPQQTVTSFNLSGQTTSATYHMVPASEKAPPVLTPPSSVPVHIYPGVVYPSQNHN